MLTVLTGDAIEQLRTLPDESVHCVCTSPPYWGLREYGVKGQYGLERTPEEYVGRMVEVFREVRRVLRSDGTLWLNLGDSYANGLGGAPSSSSTLNGGRGVGPNEKVAQLKPLRKGTAAGCKSKDLVGIPWRVAFGLQADGWWLRSDIIWAKPNPMPESVTDRPTKSHEYLFLLTKASTYYYDAEAIKEPSNPSSDERYKYSFGSPSQMNRAMNETVVKGDRSYLNSESGRNKRSVWTVVTAPYPEAHFATYPPDLVKPCILAGTSAKGCCAKCGAPWERVVEQEERITDGRRELRSSGRIGESRGTRSGTVPGSNTRGYPQYNDQTLGWQPTCRCGEPSTLQLANGITSDLPFAVEPCTVLDPFAGSGTTGAVALELGRKAILIELNPKYVELIEERCTVTIGLALAC